LFLGRARQWRRDIEECTQPSRTQKNVDAIGSDVDALDQRGQQGVLARSGHSGQLSPISVLVNSIWASGIAALDNRDDQAFMRPQFNFADDAFAVASEPQSEC
jgi:hypothetical protein